LTTKQATFKCPECGEKFNYAKVLGSHRRLKHGVAGTSHSVLAMRKKREAQPPPATPPMPVLNCPDCDFAAATTGGLLWHRRAKHNIIAAHRPKNMRRELEPGKTQTITIAATHNGHKEDWQGHTDGIPEALIAVTSGRFQELCRSVAYEHDLPPRLFAARVAAFVYGTTLR
jgi:hypothetical protein